MYTHAVISSDDIKTWITYIVTVYTALSNYRVEYPDEEVTSGQRKCSS